MSHADSECKHRTEVEVNIDDINVTEERPENKIQLTDEIGIKLRYAGVNDLKTMNPDSSEDLFALIVDCIEFIYDSENVYSEFTKKELADWLEQLSSEQFKKITNFFETAPKLSHTIEWTCSACGEEDSLTLEGLTSFFT
jgi:dissimilatory sulfite reductase (desulfoviridin) alpha/beta subunit